MTSSPQSTSDQWDAFVRNHPRGHVLQLSAWGILKSAFGWSVERVVLGNEGSIIAGAQLLYRRLPFGLGTMAYLSMGPLLTEQANETALWQAINEAARSKGARFLKWEPGVLVDEADRPDYAKLGFMKSPQTIQPPRTILIDIGDSEETIMARMNQGTRRKIRQSYKKDVRYFHGQRADMAVFNRLMQTTGARNEFGVHEPGYYDMAYDLFVAAGDAVVIFAEHEGDLLAAIMVFALNDTAWYLYGASSDVKRNLMASYGVQWEAMQWARARGCRYYDLWGIPDAGEDALEAQFQARNDGLWGVYGFKRGWGGRIVRSEGAWDKPYNRLVYLAYQAALRLRGVKQD